MKKFSIKSLCVILSILTAIMSLPMTAFALDLSDNNTASEIVESGDNALTAQKDIIEMTDMRTASVKYFRLEDGGYYAAQYDSAVHYQDENGDWQDIDNTLAVSGSEITTSNAKIKFAKKTTGNSSLFTLHDGNRKLTMSLDGAAKKVAGEITNHETEFGEDATKLQKMTTLDKINASVIYRDILPGVDLEYVVTGLNIKENIIVKEQSSNYSYSFTMQLNNLTAILNEKGEIIISEPSSDEALYIIPAPVMWDANNVTSDKATMSLTDHGNGKYTLVVTADSAWMNAEERVYPVTIDPPIYAHTSSNVVDLDMTTTSASNYISSDSLYVSSTWRAYWRVTSLPVLPSSAYIVDAQFILNCFTTSGLNGYVGLYEVLTDWDSTLIWSMTTDSTAPKGTPASNVTDYQKVMSGAAQYHWDITSLVSKWYSNSASNYGVMLAPVAGTTFTGTAQFRSSEYTTTSARPRLCITYQDMKGVEDYWSYTSQSAGLAGTGSINNATGKLSFAIPTISTADHLLPYTPTLVYNGDVAGKSYGAGASVPYIGANTGYGFKLSMCESISKTYAYNENGSYITHYRWADADGTEHYFIPFTDEEGTTTYRDDDGLLYTLEETDTTFIITDSNQTVRTFTRVTSSSNTLPGGLLSTIEDRYGNKIRFDLGDAGEVKTISLIPNGSASKTSLIITYNTNGLITRILDPTSQKAVIFYYSSTYNGTTLSTTTGNYLRKVEWAHQAGSMSTSNWDSYMLTGSNSYITSDATATYSYNGSGNLISARDNISEYQVNYTYTGKKVTGVTEVAGTATTGQSIGLTYSDGYTIVRSAGSDDVYGTSDDMLTRYVFDKRGRVANMYSTDVSGTQIYGAISGEYEQDVELAKNSIKTQTVAGGATTNYLLNGNFEAIEGYLTHWTTTTNVGNGLNINYIGLNSACFDIQTNTTDSLSQCVFLPQGKYTLSLDVNIYYGSGAEMRIKVISLSDSSYSVVEDVPINEYYASGSPGFFSMNFEARSRINGGERFKIVIEVTGGGVLQSTSAEICVDNIMLEENIGSSGYSLVQFGNFDDHAINTSGVNTLTWDDCWTPTTSGVASRISEGGVFNNVAKITGVFGSERYIEQTIYTASSWALNLYDTNLIGDTAADYIVSGFGKGTEQVASQDSKFRILVNVHYYRGSGNSDQVVSYPFDFLPGMTDWQFTSGSFSTVDGALIRKIVVRCEYTNHPGTAFFDNISIVESKDNNVHHYEYYKDTGLVSRDRVGFYSDYYHYDDYGNMTYHINNRGECYEYIYDTAGKKLMSTKFYEYKGTYDHKAQDPLSSITETLKNTTTYTYNAYGQPTATTTTTPSSNQVLTTTTQYHVTSGSHIFGAQTKTTDSMGRSVEYFYDATTGYLMAVIQDNDDGYYGTAYTYDALGNITSVVPATISASGTYTSVTDTTEVTYGYNYKNQLSAIYTPSTNYYFTYDAFGNTTSISAWYATLAQYSYNSNNGKINTITYGNGHGVRYVYDELDNIKEVWYTVNGNEIKAYEYSYTAYGQLARFDDLIAGQSVVYSYDNNHRLTHMISFDTESMTNELSQSVTYDGGSRVSHVHYSLDYNTPSTVTNYRSHYFYTYKEGDQIDGMDISTYQFDGGISYEYDDYGRLDVKTINFVSETNSTRSFTNTIEYYYRQRTVGTQRYTSAEIDEYVSIVNNNERIYTFTYDDGGNIIEIGADEGDYDYQYDAMGQLVRENNEALDRTYLYTYDDGGNILTKAIYEYTTAATPSSAYWIDTIYYNYTDYDWKDKLTSYDGQTITYDTIGNPTAIGSATLTWRGRQLMQYVNGSNTYAYTYNDEGIRTSKTVNGVTHTYHLSGSQIVAEEWGNNLLVYLYDAEGAPLGMQYRNTTYATNVFDTYWFEKNMQGDIIAVYDDAGTLLISYLYDAWGNVTTTYSNGGASTNAVYNPFKYRGYYHDSETGWYYLQSRYYNPTWGRFINADNYINANGDLLGFNMFAYCGNNPVMGYDPTGEWNWGGVVAGLGIIAATAVTVATFGAGSGLGVLIAAAAITTGATMTYAAATDSAMVIDVSASAQVEPDKYAKVGFSLIIDFSEDGGIYGYSHIGGGYGKSEGFSYSTGLVDNLSKPEDYSRHFIDINAGYYAGYDHCFDPTKDYNSATKASAITFGTGANFGIGYDYYSTPIIFTKWGE